MDNEATTVTPDVEGGDMDFDQALSALRAVNGQKFAALQEIGVGPSPTAVLSARIEALANIVLRHSPELRTKFELLTESAIGKLMDAIVAQLQAQQAEAEGRDPESGLFVPPSARDGLVTPQGPVELPKQPLRVVPPAEG